MILLIDFSGHHLHAAKMDNSFQVQDMLLFPKQFISPIGNQSISNYFWLQVYTWCHDSTLVFYNQQQADHFRSTLYRFTKKKLKNEFVLLSCINYDAFSFQNDSILGEATLPITALLSGCKFLNVTSIPIEEMVAITKAKINRDTPYATANQVATANYIYDIATKRLHRKDCAFFTAHGPVYAFSTIDRGVGRGYTPCSCCQNDYYRALRYRNLNIIQKLQFPFLFATGSNIIHRRTCSRLLMGRKFGGFEHWEQAAHNNFRPCKVCGPEPLLSKNNIQALPSSLKTAYQIYQHIDMDIFSLTNRTPADRRILQNPKMIFICSESKIHIRTCPTVHTIHNVRGYSSYADAAKGRSSCQCCRPSRQNDAHIYIPYFIENGPSTPQLFMEHCQKVGFSCSRAGSTYVVDTSVGQWFIHTDHKPFLIEHRNLSFLSGESNLHTQPIRPVTWRETFLYIYHHDENLVKLLNEKHISLPTTDLC